MSRQRIRRFFAELSIAIGVLLAIAVVLFNGEPLFRNDEDDSK